jgi:chemotaxis protein CheY-P-specific phosphatase CheC
MSGDDDLLQVLVEVSQNLGFLTPTGPAEPLLPEAQSRLVEVRFHGGREGRVLLAFGPGVAEALVRNLTLLERDVEPDPADCAAAAYELANVVAGNVLASLFGDSIECHLDTPQDVAPATLPANAIGLELEEGALAAAVEA